MEVKVIVGWLEDIKSEHGRIQFLGNGIKPCLAHFKEAVGGARLDDSVIFLLRLLRNSVPMGAAVVTAILEGGVVADVQRLISYITERQHQSDADFKVLTACAQLLANLANSGPAGADAVWDCCYPDTLSYLAKHPKGEVHAPATLALHACCRQDLHRSEQLCGFAACSHSNRADSQDAAAAERTDCDRPTGTGTSTSSDPGAALAAVQERARIGARAIWEALLGRLVPQQQILQQQPSSAATSGSGSNPDWTSLLCSCVALRQGLLLPLLSLLSPAGLPGSGGDGVAATAAAATATAASPLEGSALSGVGPRGASAAVRGEPAAAAGVRTEQSKQGCFGVLCPVLLYVLAEELYEMKGGGAVDLGGEGRCGAAACATHVAAGVGELSSAPASPMREAADVPEAGAAGAEAESGAAAGTPGMDGGAAARAEAGFVGARDGCGDVCGGLTGAPATTTSGLERTSSLPVAARPLGRALLYAMDVAEAAARRLGTGGHPRPTDASARRGHQLGAPGASGNGDAGASGVSGAAGHPAEAASEAPSVVAAAGELAAGDAASAADREALDGAVLEAALEVLKSVVKREDGGRDMACGADVAGWLLCGSTGNHTQDSQESSIMHSGDSGSSSSGCSSSRGGGGDGALPRILGMLAALQPAAAARHRRQAASAVPPQAASAVAPQAASAVPPQAASAVPPQAASAQPVPAAPHPAAPPHDRPLIQLPTELGVLASGFPREPPYIGYRGDLVSVLANGAFRRPQVVSELVARGGLELMLAQTNLDDRSPLAREWALWGVRNMCEGSEEVQRLIAGLELQTAVETPELQKLGLRLELDKATGKMKVSKTQGATEMLNTARSRALQ